MKQLTLGEAQHQLAALLEAAARGESVEITGDGVTYEIRVSALKSQPTQKRTAGLGKGSLVYMSEDFDDELPESFWLGDE